MSYICNNDIIFTFVPSADNDQSLMQEYVEEPSTPEWVVPIYCLAIILPENCMNMKTIGPRWGARPQRLHWIRH